MAKKKYSKKKKWNKVYIIITGVVVLLIVYILIIYQIRQKKEVADFAPYPGFGIELPVGYTIHGIDISSYQGNVFWPSVVRMKDSDVSLKFAFIKATEGLNNVDKQFFNNWKNAKAAHITRGAYHFFIATKSGSLQAQHFIKTVNLQPGDLPPVLDIEELYGVRPDSMRSRVAAWLSSIEAAYMVKPVIYTNVSFYKNYLGHRFDGYLLWVAHYFVQKQPGIAEGWAFWQHNAAGKVNGIKTPVDFNVFHGDSIAFNKLLFH